MSDDLKSSEVKQENFIYVATTEELEKLDIEKQTIKNNQEEK